MGTFILNKYFDDEYRRLYYGMYESLDKYYQIVHKKQIHIPSSIIPSKSRFSVDHLTLTELTNIGILKDSKSRFYFAIIREPIERFISLCNYWNTDPKTLIYNITKIHLLKQTHYLLFSHLRPQCDYINDLQKNGYSYRLFTMKRKEEIQVFLRDNFPNIPVPDFTEKVYASKEKYTVCDLGQIELSFLQNYYREDIHLYHLYH